MSWIALWGWVLGLLAMPVAAQAPPSLADLPPTKALTQYVADAWGSEEGLPQSRVETVTQAADGHLWFGTQEGLVRFDGVDFTVVGREPGGLPDNDIRALAPDDQGGVWVGTRRGGLAHIDPDLRIQSYGTDLGLSNPAVASIVVAPDGGVWAGTFDGLCRLDPARQKFACIGTDDGLPHAYIRVLLQGRDGTLWVGTRGGLARVDGGRPRSLVGLGGAAAEPVGALAEDARGGLWIGPRSGHPLGYLRGGALRARPEADAAEGSEVASLWADPHGSLWIGTVGDGLVRARGERVDRLAEAAGADLSSVLALFRDREGSLWIGTGGGGLARLRNAKFTPVTEREGMPDNRVYSIAADPRGGVWAGTTGGLARIVDGQVVGTVTAEDGLLGDDVSTVYATRDGSVWVGIEGQGLCRMMRGRIARCFTPENGLPDPFVIALFEDAEGTFWVGTATALSRWTGSTLAPLNVPGAPEAPVTALADGAGGRLWIGTYGQGLLRYDGRDVSGVAGTEDDNVLALHTEDDGRVWVGTDGSGILLVEGESGAQVHRVTSAQGLPSGIVPKILGDGQGRIWITSNRGVAVASAADLARAARTGQPASVTLFGRADGLPSAEANGGSQPAGARAVDGTLYLPTNGGVAFIDPARIPRNRQAPPVVIEGMRVDGEPVPTHTDGISLAPGPSEFEITYAGLSYFTPGRVQHRYRLDGRDAHWTEAGDRRTAFYTDLAPGDYVFRVQASNGDGVWSETDATLAFTLRPHFWQTGWFWALCALVAVGLAVAAYKARTVQLRARAEHLERVVTERTHELAEEKALVERLNDQLSTLNATLQDQVREQLAQIVRGSRLQKYFPKKVVDRILNQEGDVTVEAERRPVTVVFTDLAGFTRLSEATPPERVTALLNEYLNEMVALIDTHGGTLDKFMGDGIMVLFGAADPMPPADQARRAVEMATAMQAAMSRLRAKWQSEGLPYAVDLRIGIHQAEVTVGNFGSDELVEFTAIGRGVNLAARLEGACDPGGVLVSDAVHSLTDGAFDYAAPRDLSLKGIDTPVRAFPVRTEPEAVAE